MNETKQNYQGYPIVQVKILSVRSNKLTVSLPDKSKGVIAKREWSWERGVNQIVHRFKEGEYIKAVLLPPREKSDFIYLSIRELHDPWKNSHQYEPGQTVIGEVINIRDSAVYVQLKPGIVPILWPKDMPLLPEQLPGDVLVIGDKIRAEITHIDRDNRKMEVSLLLPLRKNFNADEQVNLLKSIFQSSLETLQERVLSIKKVEEKPTFQKQFIHITPLSRLLHVLLVDDNSKDSDAVSKLLKKQYDATVHWAESGNEALELLRQQEISFDLVLIDMNLNHGEHGTQVCNQILEIAPQLPIIFMSTDLFAEYEIAKTLKVENYNITFAAKSWIGGSHDPNSNELLKAIENLKQGKMASIATGEARHEEQLVAGLEQSLSLNLPLHEKFSQFLQELALETQVKYALLLKLDSEKREVTLLAGFPRQEEALFARNMDGLYYSPVRDVIEEGETFYIGRLDEEGRRLNIKNFFSELSFISCYGLPIKVAGAPSEYALFVLDKRTDLFWNIISRIRLTASYVSLAIEKDQFMAGLRQKLDLALRGELMGTFLHELHNKLQPLLGFAEDGLTLMDENRKEEFWQYFKNAAPDILKIKELAQAYGRLAKDDMEQVDLNEVAKKVHHQLAPHAQGKGINLLLQTKDLPSVRAIAIHVEQVLTNIVLNAIQHIEEQNRHWRQVNQSAYHLVEEHLQEYKLVVISTCAAPTNDACCIAVMDTGGGVPFNMRERIFQLGVSTREGGHGLGLFISRNLIENMRGYLEWVDSVRPWGSAFAIIFPITKAETNGTEND